MGKATGPSRRWRVAVPMALLSTAALALWPNERERTPHTSQAAGSSKTAVSRTDEMERSEPARAVAATHFVARPPEPAQTEHLPGDKPHPITAAHERIYRENNLVGALDVAVDLEDFVRIRELVAQYRAAYPEDAYRLQDGYALIADCLERLDAATRARAQRFWDTEIRSQTRRYVRRYCLERDNAS